MTPLLQDSSAWCQAPLASVPVEVEGATVDWVSLLMILMMVMIGMMTIMMTGERGAAHGHHGGPDQHNLHQPSLLQHLGQGAAVEHA